MNVGAQNHNKELSSTSRGQKDTKASQASQDQASQAKISVSKAVFSSGGSEGESLY